MTGGAQEGPQLAADQVLVLAVETHGAIAEIGVVLMRQRQVGQGLVAADIEGADDDRPAPGRARRPAVGLVLFVFAGRRFAVEEEKLAAEKSDGFGSLPPGRLQFRRAADVGRDLHPDAVRCFCQSFFQPGQPPLPPFLGRFLQAVVALQRRAGGRHDQTAPAVDDHFRVVTDLRQRLRRQGDGGNAVGPCQDGRVRSGAHFAQYQAAQMAAVQRQQFGGGQGGGHYHGGLAGRAPGACGGPANQFFLQLGGDVIQVVGPLPQVGAGGLLQDAGEMSGCFLDGRSGRHFLLGDQAGDPLLETGVGYDGQVSL